MRKLYLLRGAPGSGKSTFIKNNDLEAFTISSDVIRLQLESLAYDIKGNPFITQTNNKQAWQLLMTSVEERLKRGCLTIVDATHSNYKDIKNYFELINKYKYELYVINFDLPYEELIRNNQNRASHKIVATKVIDRFYERMQNTLPDSINVIQPEEFGATLQIDIDDLNQYKNVYLFGDLQGCFESLDNFFKDFPFSKDNYYIFVGDYIDRGIENKEVLEFIFSIMEEDNVCLIEGNHERHLFNHIHDNRCENRGFMSKTLPQIQDLDEKQIKILLSKLKDVKLFTFEDKNFIVTHTGLPFLPKDLALIPSRQFIRGIGTHADDIDKMFNDEDNGWYQAHGHRNNFEHPIVVGRSINLEGRVEFGGSLRVAKLGKGIHAMEYKQTKIDENLKPFNSKDKRPLIERLRSNEHINEKDLGDDVSSFNFSRKVFYKRLWNNQTIKARGLFLNNKTGEIVARSYEKFFNKGEREETSDEALKKLKYPVTSYLKENGFLGIVSVHKGELFFASKSTNQSDFATYFKDIAEKTLDLDFLKDFCSKGFSMVFEVVDIENDPHIIEYKENKIFLLDIIYNQEQFKKLSYKELQGIGKKLKAPVKKKECVLKDYDALKAWLDLVKDVKEEGYVLEASDGFMLKIKLPFYNYWKSLRTIRDRILKDKELREESIDDNVKFMLSLDKEVLDTDIISIRKMIEDSNEN